MTNPTATAFGYPHTLVAETTHWLVLVRPKQPTWGSLALVCKEPVQAFAHLSAEAFADLKVATTGIEAMDAGLTFTDAGWPGPPAVGQTVDLDADQAENLARRLGEAWPRTEVAAQ